MSTIIIVFNDCLRSIIELLTVKTMGSDISKEYTPVVPTNILEKCMFGSYDALVHCNYQFDYSLVITEKG